jgi:hypothetical protein
MHGEFQKPTGSFYPLEQTSALLQITRSPKFFKNLERAQSFGRCIFEYALFVQNASSHPHCAAQVVWVICVGLGLVDVCICVVEPPFGLGQNRQLIINQKQLFGPPESRRNAEGCFEMVNGLFALALGCVYTTKASVRFADQKFFPFLWK